MLKEGRHDIVMVFANETAKMDFILLKQQPQGAPISGDISDDSGTESGESSLPSINESLLMAVPDRAEQRGLFYALIIGAPLLFLAAAFVAVYKIKTRKKVEA